MCVMVLCCLVSAGVGHSGLLPGAPGEGEGAEEEARFEGGELPPGKLAQSRQLVGGAFQC